MSKHFLQVRKKVNLLKFYKQMELHNLRKQYDKSALSFNDLDADPIVQFQTLFKMAQDEGEDEPNAMTLATVDANTGVDARIVLLKEVHDNGFVFFTNYESSKGRQLTADGRAALVFFWQTLQVQVRVTGLVRRTSAEVSDKYFDSRPIESRIGAILSRQSAIIENVDAWVQQFQNVSKDADQTAVRRPANWGGFILVPSKIEFWQGRPNRLHDRFRYTRQADNWIIDQLYP